MLIKQNGKYGAMVGNIRVFTMERAVEVYKMFAALCYADLTMEASVVLSNIVIFILKLFVGHSL